MCSWISAMDQRSGAGLNLHWASDRPLATSTTGHGSSPSKVDPVLKLVRVQQVSKILSVSSDESVIPRYGHSCYLHVCVTFATTILLPKPRQRIRTPLVKSDNLKSGKHPVG